MMRLILLPVLLALMCVRACGAVAGQPTLPQSAELRRWFSMVKEVEDGLARGDSHFTFQMKKIFARADEPA